jgi:spermidine synthase
MREFIQVSKRRFLRWWLLFLVSSLGLFLELAVVRWISGEVRLMAYFKNLPLLAAFLGLSIGYALVGKGRDYKQAFAPLLGLFVVLVLVVGRFSSPGVLAYPGAGDEFLWGSVSYAYWLSLALFLGIVLIFFLCTVFLFIPLGQATGEEMARHAPVPAYIINILASLAGVWMFSFLSYLQSPPLVWFGLGLLGVGLYMGVRRTLSRLTVVIFVAVLIGLTIFGRGAIWSPYQRLEVKELSLPRRSDGAMIDVGYNLTVQQIFYQQAVDLSPEALSKLQGEIPELEDRAFLYNLPYRLGPEGGRVLIVGAGMGNDVAAALRSRAAHVDAVEIDPAILALGRELHPEHPYDDSRVTLVVDDARSFFKRSTEQYDVVAFGLLDSHTLLSGLSSVRLDSFVYTLESFEEVKGHLTEDGLVAVTFAVGEGAPWIEERLGQMLAQVFGADRVYVRSGVGGGDTVFVAGLISPDRLAEAQMSAWRPGSLAERVPLTTDDWPYLYMRARTVPAAYWQALLVVGVVCFILLRRSFPRVLRPDWHFWLLGAAFLLVEFKSVTEFALLFGTTWLVNALAISGVLLMALAANLVVLWRPRVDLRLVYGFLFASLTLVYFLPLDTLSGLPVVIRAAGGMVLLSVPLFFAGMIFSESLRRAGETAGPLASNLSGSVVGGVLEYGSLLWGVKSLYVIAALLYGGALVAFWLRRK